MHAVKPGSPAYLITGATSGIGRAAAQRLSADGARVWIIGTQQSTVEATCAELGLAGGSACDVSEADQVTRSVAEAVTALGQLSGVFLNAGIDGQGVATSALSAKHFRRVLDVNVLGSFLTIQAALPHLAANAAVLFNASVNALRPEPGFLDYNASKAAVLSMSQSLALELAPAGFRVNCLCPGYFPTRMTGGFLADPDFSRQALALIPTGRIGELTEIADLIAYLLGPAPGFLTGAVIPIDGGRCLI